MGTDGPAPAGREPDHRFTLANERTFLARMRTALTLLAGGVAVNELASPVDLAGGRSLLAAIAIVLSLVLVLDSYRWWGKVDDAMRHDQPLPRSLGVPLLTVGLSAIAVIALIVVLM